MPPYLNFEWDEKKAQTNLAKHHVEFAYATAVFLDPFLLKLDVSRPHEGENRQKAIGSVEGRVLTVVYTIRGETTRVISARRSSASERKLYDSLQA
jgi:uncharacterized DUF497 family protein